MIVKNFSPFSGRHCETTATGSLLKHIGIELSEPMLFGLGAGLGFIYWDMKSMDFPFIGGRIKPDLITKNLVDHLGLELELRETSSSKIAWDHVRNKIDNGIPVGLKLDCYYLDYFTRKIHFAAHYVAMYGYDDKYAYLVDTVQQGSTAKVSLKNLELARNEKGPMSSKNLSYTIAQKSPIHDLEHVIIKAIRKNAEDFLNPPIKNIGYRGIEKASVEIRKWLKRTKKPKEDLELVALLMERGGTGGALFRNMYRDFLKESMDILGSDYLKKSHDMFCDIASLWTEVARLIHQAGESGNQNYLNQASEILTDLADKEKVAMELLLEAVS